MTIEDIGMLAGIAASIGVVISLVYLAIQLRQNTRGLRTAAHQYVVSANAAVTMTPAQNLEFAALLWKGALNSRDLSEDTHLAFNLWCFQYFSMIQAAHQLFLADAIDKAIWERELQRAVGALRAPGFRAWWDAGGRSQLTAAFVSLVESTPLDIQGVAWNNEQGFVPAEWTVSESP